MFLKKTLTIVSVLFLLISIGVSFAFTDYYTIWSNGDEVHYLGATQSLIKDRDLGLRNNYENRDYFEHHASPIRPHATEDLNGRLKPFHGSMLSLIVIPGYMLNTLKGARFAILIWNIFFSLILIWILKISNLNLKNSVFTVAVFLMQPVVLFSLNAIYPDLMSGFLGTTVAGLLLFYLNKKDYRILIFASILAGLMGFLHTKLFLMSAIILGNFFLFDSGIYTQIIEFFKNTKKTKFNLKKTISDSWNFIQNFTTKNFKYLLALFLPFFAILSYYLISSILVFGGIFVNGEGILFVQERNSDFVNSPIQVFFGQLLDINRGLIPFGPIFLLIPAGVTVWIKKSFKSFLLIFVSGFIFYLINTLSVAFSDVIWYAGWSPPARYMLNVIPFSLPAIGFYISTFKDSLISRFIFISLFLVSVSLVLIYPFSAMSGFYSVNFGRNIYYEDILEIFNLKKLMFFFLNFEHPGIKDYLFGFIILLVSLLEAVRINFQKLKRN